MVDERTFELANKLRDYHHVNQSFEKYPNDEIPLEKVINIMVGDLQRIKIYPEKGFQIFQEIPNEVWLAYEQLVSLGYDKYLVK